MKRFTRYILMLPLVLALGACDSTGAEFGSLTLLLTDEPGDVSSAWVTIERIYLQPGEGEDAGRRQDLLTEAVTVDLITLADAIVGLVENAVVPTGFYEQLRVVVGEACIVAEGEADAEGQPTFEVYATQGFTRCGPADGTLETPSLDQTGIKVLLPGDGLQVTGDQQILLLDFDVSESFGMLAGFSGSWVMNPVIRGSAIELTASITVSLSAGEGVTFPDGMTLGSFAADLASEEVDAPFSGEEGADTYNAVFRDLIVDAERDFTVRVVGPDGYDFTFEPASAEPAMASGQDAQVSFTLTAIDPQAG